MLQRVFAKPDMEISVVNDSMEDILGKKNKSTGKFLLHMYSGYVHTHKNDVMQRGANTPHSSPVVACSLLLFFLYKIQKSRCHNFSVDTSSKSTPSYTHLNSFSKFLINIFSYQMHLYTYIHTCCLYACPNTHGCLKNSHECITKPFRRVLVLPYNFVRLQSGCFCNYESVTFSCYVFATVCVCIYWQLWTVF